MARILIITAAGFSDYRDTAHEIKAIEDGLWLPQTVDFEATARFTRGAKHLGASDAGTFFGALSTVGAERRIIFIGHGNGSDLGLKGSAGIFKAAVGLVELKKFRTTIHSKIRPKLRGKTLDLIACNVGVGEKMPQQLAKDLGVEVRAFKGAVRWYVDHDDKKITSRGLICSNSKCSNKIKGAHRIKPPVVIKP